LDDGNDSDSSHPDDELIDDLDQGPLDTTAFLSQEPDPPLSHQHQLHPSVPVAKEDSEEDDDLNEEDDEDLDPDDTDKETDGVIII